MQLFHLLTALIVSIAAAGSDTIHYTNSPSYLATGSNYTAYKLDVPGTNGITIIETMNGADDPDPDDKYYPTQGPTQGSKKMVYAPDLLHKFIEEYNAKPKNTHNMYNQDEDGDIEMEVKPSENRRVTRVKVHNKRKQQQPDDNRYDDKNGWVTLDAVPWSKSKVSKWKPNRNKGTSATMSSVNLYNVRPISSLENTQMYYSGGEFEDNKYIPKPMKRPALITDTYKNHGFYDRKDQSTTLRPDRYRPRPFKKKDPSYYNTPEPELEVDSDFDRWFDYGFRPDSTNDNNRRPSVNNYHQSNETPKPPRKNFLSSNNRYSHRNEVHNKGTYTFNNYDSPYEQDREQSYLYQERPDPLHPATYPTNGNGEWVLVSSTKGYQYPSRRQRGITFNSSPNPSNYTVRTHKSIKLTVLPAKGSNSNETPMTTSHGGLIEVESDQQTVEDSVHKVTAKKTKRKAHMVGGGAGGGGTIQGIAVDNGDDNGDSTAVLAAVGAGMVPATVAMLMPMLGRKKRDIGISVQDRPIYLRESNLTEY